MKLSELITYLQEIQQSHGDINVWRRDFDIPNEPYRFEALESEVVKIYEYDPTPEVKATMKALDSGYVELFEDVPDYTIYSEVGLII